MNPKTSSKKSIKTNNNIDITDTIDDVINDEIDDLCLIKNLSINNENEEKDNINNTSEISTSNLSKDIDDIYIIKDLLTNDNNLNTIKNESNANSKINVFDKIKYFENLDVIIRNILSRFENNILTFDILDTEKSSNIKLISLKEKQRQMKIGEIWQEVLGNYDGYINLKTGHESGLDIISHSKKVAIELKNRTNTDNASAKKSNFDKLANFKKKNPEYTCIYANINADTEKKTLKGMIKNIKHNDIEIQHQVGYAFLKFILEDDVNIVIDFVKNTINKYI